MKSTTILTALSGVLAFNVQSVLACYGSGISFSSIDRNAAKTFASDACYNNGGMFTGVFAARQTKSMCPQSSSGRKILFEVQNLNTNTGFDLANNDCYGRLNDILNSCEYGSQDTIAGWRFRIQAGAC